jgi:hypothetical protein
MPINPADRGLLILTSLEEENLVIALPADDRRRPYRISPAGMQVLKNELSAQASISRIGLDRLASAGR